MNCKIFCLIDMCATNIPSGGRSGSIYTVSKIYWNCNKSCSALLKSFEKTFEMNLSAVVWGSVKDFVEMLKHPPNEWFAYIGKSRISFHINDSVKNEP